MSATLEKKKRRATKRPAKSGAGAAVEAWPLAESREAWLRRLRAEYTPEVCAQTLALNESLPVHSEP